MSTEELLAYFDERVKYHRQAHIDCQVELLVEVFRDKEGWIKRMKDEGRPFVIILGANMARLQPFFAQEFKTFVDPILSPNQIIITLQNLSFDEMPRFAFPEKPYEYPPFMGSPWRDFYHLIKKKPDGDATD